MEPRKMISILMQLTPRTRQLDFADAIATLQDKNFQAKVKEEKIQAIFNLKKCLSDMAMAPNPGEKSQKFIQAAREQKLFEEKGIPDLSDNETLRSLIIKAARARTPSEYKQHLQSISELTDNKISAKELDKGIGSIVDTTNVDETQWIEKITNWLQCKIILDFIKKNSPPVVNVVNSYAQTMSEIADYFEEKRNPLVGGDNFSPVRVQMIECTINRDSKSLGTIQDNLDFLMPRLTDSKESMDALHLQSAIGQVIRGDTTIPEKLKNLNLDRNVPEFLLEKHMQKQKILPVEKWILDLEKISKNLSKNDPQRTALGILSTRLREKIIAYEKTKELDLTDIRTTLNMTKKALTANASSYGNIKVAVSRLFANLKSPTALKYINKMEEQLNILSPEIDKRKTISAAK